jgi:putative Ca2+/H+ antiporter (TMEM165/GDT1 family)
MPGWTRHPAWGDRHRAWLIAGTMIATMAIFFQAFVGAAPADLLFKEITNAIAAVLFVLLVVRVERGSVAAA